MFLVICLDVATKMFENTLRGVPNIMPTKIDNLVNVLEQKLE